MFTLRVKDMPRFAVADGRVQEALRLAEKALDAGKWEKAQAYALVAQVWQGERDEARKELA